MRKGQWLTFLRKYPFIVPRYGETRVLAVLFTELLWRHGNRVDEQVSSWQLQVHGFHVLSWLGRARVLRSLSHPIPNRGGATLSYLFVDYLLRCLVVIFCPGARG